MEEQGTQRQTEINAAERSPHRLPVEQMRVAIVSDAMTGRNGVDTYYRDLLSHLRSRVEEVRYFSPNPEDGKLSSRLRMPLPGDATQQLIFPRATSLYGEIKDLRPHIIVAATNGPFGLFAVYAARKTGAQLIAGFHTLIEDLCNMYWGKVLGSLSSSYMEFQNWLIFRYASHVVVNSVSMVESATRLSDTPVTLMGTPLDSRFVDVPIREPSGQLQRILYAGRLAPEKNLDALLAAARELAHIEFHFAGDGPLREEVQAHAERLDNVIYMGHLPREDIVKAIDDNDMLILPSHLEAFGTIALEAMIRQRLVLVSSHCGILSWDKLSTGLYRFDADEALHEAISRIEQTETKLREKKAATAREVSLNLHQQAITGWLQLFDEMEITAC